MSISFLFSCTANVNGNCKVNVKVNNNVLNVNVMLSCQI